MPTMSLILIEAVESAVPWWINLKNPAVFVVTIGPATDPDSMHLNLASDKYAAIIVHYMVIDPIFVNVAEPFPTEQPKQLRYLGRKNAPALVRETFAMVNENVVRTVMHPLDHCKIENEIFFLCLFLSIKNLRFVGISKKGKRPSTFHIILFAYRRRFI